jgi:hypothetical protein
LGEKASDFLQGPFFLLGLQGFALGDPDHGRAGDPLADNLQGSEQSLWRVDEGQVHDLVLPELEAAHYLPAQLGHVLLGDHDLHVQGAHLFLDRFVGPEHVLADHAPQGRQVGEALRGGYVLFVLGRAEVFGYGRLGVGEEELHVA